MITDALDMKAISASVGHAEGAVRSLAAGADLVCIGNPGYPETYDADARLGLVVDAVVAAVEQGRLEHRPARAGGGPRLRLARLAAGGAHGEVEDVGDVAARAVTSRGDVRVANPGSSTSAARSTSLPATATTTCARLLEASAGDGRLVVLAGHPSQLAEVADLVGRHPDAVVVWSGIDVEVPGDHVVLTHGGGRAVAEAAADVILGEVR